MLENPSPNASFGPAAELHVHDAEIAEPLRQIACETPPCWPGILIAVELDSDLWLSGDSFYSSDLSLSKKLALGSYGECGKMNNKNIVIAFFFALSAFIIFAALGPAKMIPRTGLGWQVDHFAGYFVFTVVSCCIWRRVFVVGASITSLAVLLEICQGSTPDRIPDVTGAFFSTFGILVATFLVDFVVPSHRKLFSLSFLRMPF